MTDWRPEARMLECSNTGVWYAQPHSWERPPEGLVAYHYTSERHSSGIVFSEVVYCLSEADFTKLLNHWNINPGREYVYGRVEGDAE